MTSVSYLSYYSTFLTGFLPPALPPSISLTTTVKVVILPKCKPDCANTHTSHTETTRMPVPSALKNKAQSPDLPCTGLLPSPDPNPELKLH